MTRRTIAVCITTVVGSTAWALLPAATAHADFCENVGIRTPNFTPVGECVPGYDLTPYNCQQVTVTRLPTFDGTVTACFPD